MNMNLVKKKITYRMYPTKTQLAKLDFTLEHHRQLYNAALQERIEAYRVQRKSVSKREQEKELTQLRKEVPEYSEFNAQSQQKTLKRLDLAFQNFFRRVKNGETPGFPRFKTKDLFRSFGFKANGDGYKLLNGRVRISNIGEIKLRGKSKYQGIPKESQIFKKNDKWYISVTLETKLIKTNDEPEYSLVAADWGTKTLLILGKVKEDSSIEFEKIENPKILNSKIKELKELKSKCDKTRKGSFKRKQSAKKARTLHEKISNKRKDFQHKLSRKIADSCKVFITEKLNVKGMVSTDSKPLFSRQQQRNQSRSTLDTSPASLFSMIRYKVLETGSEYAEINTRDVKPTQRCSKCWSLIPKTLADRIHNCNFCGNVKDRDENSVEVMIKSYYGWEPTMKDFFFRNST